MADDEQLRARIDLADPGGHLAHRDVLRPGGVAALPFVVLTDVEQHDRLVERRRNVGHVLHLLDVHALMLRGGLVSTHVKQQCAAIHSFHRFIHRPPTAERPV